MNGTPRLRSAFPTTPQQQHGRAPDPKTSPSPRGDSQTNGTKLPDIGTLQSSKPQKPDPPLVSFDKIDAPSQRMYVAGFYAALFFWRLYDFYHLTLDEDESLWLFMKWVAIDGVFLFGLPSFRIPWLEWSSTTMTLLFLSHALLDGILMFRIPIPLGAGLVAMTRVLYDREIAISERRVKPGNILHNPSLILGRQIINILPEGSALLNPDSLPLCIDHSRSSSAVTLPILINQTNPIAIELIRYGFDQEDPETITLSASTIRKLRHHVEKGNSRDPSAPILLQYPVKKTGLYRLNHVLDETKLEVVKRTSDTPVLACPSAKFTPSGKNRARGDLSDLSIEVIGTPPLTMKFWMGVNGEKRTSYQNIQPEEYDAALVRQRSLDERGLPDITWAKPHSMRVPLNETLTHSGLWTFFVEQITDGLNNVVTYVAPDDESESSSSSDQAEYSIVVHDRPKVHLQGHNMEKPILVAKGQSTILPLTFSSTDKGQAKIEGTVHAIRFLFTPVEELTPDGGHGPDTQIQETVLKTVKQPLAIEKPGLYTLISVSTPFAEGEILEPASCMLINPPEPDLNIITEPIPDQCAGSPIGARIGLDLTGTPPFTVHYKVKEQHGRESLFQTTVNSLRGQVEFTPHEAGHYRLTFVSVSDTVYKATDLTTKNLFEEQEVKPSVSAYILGPPQREEVCLDQGLDFTVHFQGEGPWTLEYEFTHKGRRLRKEIVKTEDQELLIETGELRDGGDYSMALISVKDKQDCKKSLDQAVKFSVRHQKPKVAFGQIEGQRSINILQDRPEHLPLRLSGENAWSVTYRHTLGESSTEHTQQCKNVNDFIMATKPGVYQILSVHDKACPGVVDDSSSIFEVSWIPRPRIYLSEGPLIEKVGGKLVRKEVCEGDEDAMSITFEGRPPYVVNYQEHIVTDRNEKSLKNRELNVMNQNTQIKLDTSRAGSYEYVFTKLSDFNYDHQDKKHERFIVEQKVNPRPSATFADSGKVYSFCQGAEGTPAEEVIPIKLTGQPPFTVDLELRHQNKALKAQSITVPNILKQSENLHIPHSYLRPGNFALSIRRIRDARGCERHIDMSSSAPQVQISVHDPPTIMPAEERTHYCIGERIAFALSGKAPFVVSYTFQGKARTATVNSPTFRRIAETAGNFTITGLQDAASNCKLPVGPGTVSGNSQGLSKIIHDMPTVQLSKGKETRVDIHAGDEADILFEFGTSGTPPFEVTYTRSENAKMKKGGVGSVGAVLETRTLTSEERSLKIRVGEEGTYEVVAIKDRYCSFARPGAEAYGVKNQPLLQNS